MTSAPSFLRRRPTKTSIVFEVAVGVLGVDVLGQLGARDHLALVVHQVGQHPVLVAGERHRPALGRDAAGAGVERHPAAAQLGARLALGAPDQRPQAGQQLLDAERLGQVVVRPGVDALHLLLPGVAGGEDQDRHRVAGGAPAAQDREPVQPRQAEVEHDRVVGLGGAHELALLAVQGAVDGVALAAELARRAGGPARGRPRRRARACRLPQSPSPSASRCATGLPVAAS